MKQSAWIAFVAALTFAIIYFLKPPLLLFLLVGMPVLTVVLTVGSFYYSLRSTLEFQPVPAQGYENRVRDLEARTATWIRLGFDKCDGFFLKMVPDSITYAYKHRQLPVYGCIYHFGSKMSCDLITELAGDRSLTSNNTRDAGNIPRPTSKMLQVFPEASLDFLWAEHRKALAFLDSKGLAPVDFPPSEFRPRFLRSIREFKSEVLAIPFWPVKLIYWVVTRFGRNYCRRIEDQFRSGFLPADIPPGRRRI